MKSLIHKDQTFLIPVCLKALAILCNLLSYILCMREYCLGQETVDMYLSKDLHCEALVSFKLSLFCKKCRIVDTLKR